MIAYGEYYYIGYQYIEKATKFTDQEDTPVCIISKLPLEKGGIYECEYPAIGRGNYRVMAYYEDSYGDLQIVYPSRNEIDRIKGGKKMADYTGIDKKLAKFHGYFLCIGYVLREDYSDPKKPVLHYTSPSAFIAQTEEEAKMKVALDACLPADELDKYKIIVRQLG